MPVLLLFHGIIIQSFFKTVSVLYSLHGLSHSSFVRVCVRACVLCGGGGGGGMCTHRHNNVRKLCRFYSFFTVLSYNLSSKLCLFYIHCTVFLIPRSDAGFPHGLHETLAVIEISVVLITVGRKANQAY